MVIREVLLQWHFFGLRSNTIILQKNQFVSFVSINMDEYRKKFNNKSIKKTLTIPAWLNYLSEKNNINFSQVLQEALKERLGID